MLRCICLSHASSASTQRRRRRKHYWRLWDDNAAFMHILTVALTIHKVWVCATSLTKTWMKGDSKLLIKKRTFAFWFFTRNCFVIIMLFYILRAIQLQRLSLLLYCVFRTERGVIIKNKLNVRSCLTRSLRVFKSSIVWLVVFYCMYLGHMKMRGRSLDGTEPNTNPKTDPKTNPKGLTLILTLTLMN